MIDVKELRLSNWVLDSEGVERQVTVISAQGRVFLPPVKYVDRMPKILKLGEDCSTDLVNPITITPEVLEACGFRLLQKNNCHYVIDWPNQRISQQKISVFRSNDVFNVAFSNTLSGYVDYILPTEIEYLHQLQNLYFDLCGQELEYKPKV